MNDPLTPGNMADNSIFNQTAQRGPIDASSALLSPVMEDRAKTLASKLAAEAAALAEQERLEKLEAEIKQKKQIIADKALISAVKTVIEVRRAQDL